MQILTWVQKIRKNCNSRQVVNWQLGWLLDLISLPEEVLLLAGSPGKKQVYKKRFALKNVVHWDPIHTWVFCSLKLQNAGGEKTNILYGDGSGLHSMSPDAKHLKLKKVLGVFLQLESGRFERFWHVFIFIEINRNAPFACFCAHSRVFLLSVSVHFSAQMKIM